MVQAAGPACEEGSEKAPSLMPEAFSLEALMLKG